jgi:hypothetical protein
VAPDDLGAEWLARATEVSSADTRGIAPEAQPPDAFIDAGMSVVSEASINAASADEIESKAIADLDEDYIPLEIDELRDKESK